MEQGEEQKHRKSENVSKRKGSQTQQSSQSFSCRSSRLSLSLAV